MSCMLMNVAEADWWEQLHSITAHTKPTSTPNLGPPVSWERKSWMTLECEPTRAFLTYLTFWFWGSTAPNLPVFCYAAFKWSLLQCLCPRGQRKRRLVDVTGLQKCPWVQRGRSFVLSTVHIPLQDASRMVHDGSKSLLYIPYLPFPWGVTSIHRILSNQSEKDIHGPRRVHQRQSVPEQVRNQQKHTVPVWWPTPFDENALQHSRQQNKSK